MQRLGDAGSCAIAYRKAFGGVSRGIDSRSLCLIRETLAYADGLADFAFAMQGLGTGAISLSGSDELKQAHPAEGRQRRVDLGLRADRAGRRLGCRGDEPARRAATATTIVLDGEKTWISNGGIADVYTVFARTGEAPGTRGISAFVVFADTPGFSIAERIETIAPHPLAPLRFDNCRIPASQLLGSPGEGFKIAMRTLDIFRPSVAAAALGFARRALDEAVAHAQNRARCSARRWPTCRPRRARSATWRRRSMPRRF